jgi:hypothetical protein
VEQEMLLRTKTPEEGVAVALPAIPETEAEEAAGITPLRHSLELAVLEAAAQVIPDQPVPAAEGVLDYLVLELLDPPDHIPATEAKEGPVAAKAKTVMAEAERVAAGMVDIAWTPA